MGVAVGDFDNQGRLGLLTTTFFDDYFPLFRQDKSGFFDEVSLCRRRSSRLPSRTWAGPADLPISTTMASGTSGWPTATSTRRSPHYFEPFTVLQNHGGEFAPAFRYPAVPDNSYRGGCAGDFDNDGRIDVAVLPIAGQPLLLQNKTCEFEFLGRPAPARHAQ